MSNNQIEIIIAARDEATRALDAITQKIKAMEGATGGTSAGMEKLHEHMGNTERQAMSMSHGWLEMAKGMLAAQAIMTGFNIAYEGTIGLLLKGIKAVDDMRLAQASMASAAASNTPGKAWDEVYATTGRIVEKVYELDRAFIGTGDELLMLADSMVTYGMGIDLTTKKQQDQFVGFANMLKMMTKGQDFQRQAYQEVRALMEGENIQGALLVKKLEAAGVNVKTMVPEWREQGILLEKIMEILPGYILGSKEVEKTLQAQRTSLETITFKILREGLAPAYSDVTKLVKGVNDSLMDQNGLTEKGRMLVDGLKLAWAGVSIPVSVAASAVDWLLQGTIAYYNVTKNLVKGAKDRVFGGPGTSEIGRMGQEDWSSSMAAEMGFEGDLKLDPGKGRDDSAMKAAESLAKKIEALYDKIAIEAARERGGDMEAEIEKARIDYINRKRDILELQEKGKLGADERTEQLLVNEKVFQDEREKIVRKGEEQIRDAIDKIRKKQEEEEDKARKKRVADIAAAYAKENEAYARAAERTEELLARFREEARYATERVPRPWDVPGEKDRQRAEHDFNKRSNMLEALRRKGPGKGGITEEQFGILSAENLEAYKERLAQIEDATNQTTERLAGLWQDLASGMEQDFSGLFADAMEGRLKSLSDYFDSFAKTLEASWARFTAGMVVDWIQAQARMAASQGFGTWLSSLFGSAPATSGTAGPVGSGVHLTAKGDVFDSPQFFRFARGIGVMAEAGPEGVLPLKRTAGGDLGVQVAGRSGGGPGDIKVQIINQTGSNVRVQQGPPRFNGKEFVVTAWLEAYQNDMFGMRSALTGARG